MVYVSPMWPCHAPEMLLGLDHLFTAVSNVTEGLPLADGVGGLAWSILPIADYGGALVSGPCA